MLALIFQEPLVNVGRFAREPKWDGEQYRWFIPSGSGRPLNQTSICVILTVPLYIFLRIIPTREIDFLIKKQVVDRGGLERRKDFNLLLNQMVTHQEFVKILQWVKATVC
jgi:hypothetical protein